MTTGAGQTRTSRRSRTGVALALCAGLALSGCSGGRGEGQPSSTSSSPTASSSSPTAAASGAAATPAAQRVPKAPPATRGAKGQKAFARYATRLWAHGLRTNDARPLTRLSPKKKPCKGCAGFAASLRKRARQGWHVELPGVRVRTLTLKKVADNTYARATVDIPESTSLNDDGSFRNANKAHRGATFEVLMHRGEKRYLLLAFTVS